MEVGGMKPGMWESGALTSSGGTGVSCWYCLPVLWGEWGSRRDLEQVPAPCKPSLGANLSSLLLSLASPTHHVP